MGIALQIENLSFSYSGGIKALDSLNLTIAEKEKVGIIGANGAGKSTLVNHVNGYLTTQPGGKVIVHGDLLCKKNAELIRRQVGLVFQNSDDQLFMSRVFDDISFGPINLGLPEHIVAEKVDRCLELLGIENLRNRSPMHLSQGQKRFVALATVLVMEPSIMIMDEPTSDLDPRARKLLIQFVKKLAGTVIFVSHDLDFIWDTCSRVILLTNGAIAADGDAKKILSSESLLVDNGLELPLRLQK